MKNRRGKTDTELLKFRELTVSTWGDVCEICNGLQGWLFRGQSDASWPLSTTLERLKNTSYYPDIGLSEWEEEIINQFKRQVRHYLPHGPNDNDEMGGEVELVSLIQHHGGPTRLLDFTRSFYVASFFAIDGAVGDAAIWAINQTVLDKNYASAANLQEQYDHTPTISQSKADFAENFIQYSLGFKDEPSDDHENTTEPTIFDGPNIIAIKPWRLNQRMTIQQGWFLIPTSLDVSFEHNLCTAIGLEGDKLPKDSDDKSSRKEKQSISDAADTLPLIKLVIPCNIFLEALCDLRKMNISAATLFPGLDGFAKSLRYSRRLIDEANRENEN